MSEQISPEDIEEGLKIYLNEKGYHKELADYKKVTKELIKNNTEGNRIQYRSVVADINQKLKQELAAEQSIGNLEDVGNRLGKKVGNIKRERAAFQETYGYIPQDGDLDSAYSRELAREDFQARPTTENAARLMPTPDELARAARMKSKQNLNDALDGLHKASAEANETAENQMARAERLEAERLEREKQFQKVREDPRFGNPKGGKIPPSPLEIQMEREKSQKRTLRSDFENAGYDYGY